jgi:hypothetical protein
MRDQTPPQRIARIIPDSGSGGGKPSQGFSRTRDSDFGPGSCATREKIGARIEKLPCGAALRGEKQEHPILENSTACTMSNAKNPAIQPFWLGYGFLWKTFKQQSKSVMICSVSFKLVSCSPIPVAWHTRCAGCSHPCNQTFTESLILAQDERWRRA